VTEDILLVNEDKALDTFRSIQDLGVRVVFRRLRHRLWQPQLSQEFPLNGLKDRQVIVLELRADSGDAAIVGSTIGLSKHWACR